MSWLRQWEADLVLYAVTAWTWAAQWLTPDFLAAYETWLRFVTTLFVAFYAIVRFYRMVKGRDDDDFLGSR